MKHRDTLSSTATSQRGRGSPRTVARRGLTFIELLFSVVILGIGMIIIASVFPVAIAEQRATLDAVTANALERTAARTIDAGVSVAGAATAWLPDTTGDTVESLSTDTTPNGVWEHVKGDLISKADPHYAWTGLYQRTPVALDNNSITLFVATLASREDAQFDPTNKDTFDKLKPQAVTFKYDNSVSPNTITLTTTGTVVPCEGGFMVRSDNVGITNIPFPQNAILKLGNERTDLEPSPGASPFVFEVAPGFEYLGVAAGITGTRPAFLLGRDPSNPKGANQVLSCRAVRIDVQDPG